MKIEKQFFDLFKWLIAATVLAVMLTSCNPYQGLHEVPTATKAAEATTAAITTATKTKTPTPAPVTCIVQTGIDAGNLNIRTGAGTSYAVIGLLREGQAVTRTDESPRGNWIQIKAGQKIGWINSHYCQVQP